MKISNRQISTRRTLVAFAQAITLTTLIVAALGSRASAQITWLEQDTFVGSNFTPWYLPKLASDGNDFFLVGDIEGTTLGPIAYEIGLQPNPGSLINWPPYATEYASGGFAPSASAAVQGCCGAVVEVHQGGQDNGAALFSHLAAYGTSPPTSLNFTDGDQFDQGYNPSVAVDRLSAILGGPTDVVEVHQAAPGISALWYHVGTLSVNSKGTFTLTWGPAYQFDQGNLPSVTVDDGLAIEVHEGEPGTLWYSMGAVDGNKIDWGPSKQYDNGYNPSVSTVLYLDGETTGGWLVEVHQATNPAAGESTPLWSHLSQVTESSVEWTSAVQYDNGCNPSVALGALDNGNANINYLGEAHLEFCGETTGVLYDLGSFPWE